MASPIISIFLSTPLRKSVSLQKVAYSFGLPSRKDYIYNNIEERISVRYFLSFLSINQMFGLFKFLFEIRIFYGGPIHKVNISAKQRFQRVV